MSAGREVSARNAKGGIVLILDYNNVPTMLSGYSLLAELDYLDRSRYQPFVIFNKPCDAERAVARRGIGTAVIPHGGGSIVRRVWQYGQLPIRLWQLTRRVRPAIIHANNVMASRAALIIKKLTRVPMVVHIRNIGLPSRTAWFVLKADYFAGVSRAAIEGTLPAWAYSRATVVWDGLDLRGYPTGGAMPVQVRQRFNLPADSLIVGMAGRLSEQKGQREFVLAAMEVLADRHDVVFAHAGRIPQPNASEKYERELWRLTQELCARGRFRWLDYVDPIADFWAATDIAVVPSQGPEAFSRVVLEAMAMNRPVVATAAGGPQEIIESSEHGVLLPLGDRRGLVDAIHHLLADSSKRERMGRAARDRVEQSFAADVYVRRVMDVYDKVLKG